MMCYENLCENFREEHKICWEIWEKEVYVETLSYSYWFNLESTTTRCKSHTAVQSHVEKNLIIFYVSHLSATKQ